MVDPSGWRAEGGGSDFSFTDPSNSNPTPGAIAFDSNNVRQPGNGNQSLEFDPQNTSDTSASGAGVMIDESSDAVQPSALRAELCWLPNTNSSFKPSAGVVFAFKDSANYFLAELAPDSNNELRVVIAEVSGGGFNALSRSVNSSKTVSVQEWEFVRVDVEPAGANDLRVVVSSAPLSDYKTNGDGALVEHSDHRISNPPRQSGSVGLAYSHEFGDVVDWLDGVQFYW